MSVSRTGSTACLVDKLRHISITLLTGCLREILKSAISASSPEESLRCGVTYMKPRFRILYAVFECHEWQGGGEGRKEGEKGEGKEGGEGRIERGPNILGPCAGRGRADELYRGVTRSESVLELLQCQQRASRQLIWTGIGIP